MKYFVTIFASLSLLFTSSCNPFDNEPELPPITTEGNNTFGCLVNGKLFLPEAPFGYGTGVYAELQIYPDTVGFNIYAGNSSSKQNLILFIYDSPTIQVGEIYDLTTDTIFVSSYVDYSQSTWCYYDTIISGTVKLLKFDISNPQRKIIAGTFEFSASSPDCKDTVKITEGRFDISDVIQ